jgi:hypothetical protein
MFLSLAALQLVCIGPVIAAQNTVIYWPIVRTVIVQAKYSQLTKSDRT